NRSHDKALGLWLRFHQQVVDGEPAEQETLAILFGDGNVRAPILPQSGRGIDGPIQIAEDFPLPILEAITEGRVENSLEEALDLAGPALKLSVCRAGLAPGFRIAIGAGIQLVIGHTIRLWPCPEDRKRRRRMSRSFARGCSSSASIR